MLDIVLVRVVCLCEYVQIVHLRVVSEAACGLWSTVFEPPIHLGGVAGPSCETFALGLLHTQFAKIVYKIVTCLQPASEFCGPLCAATPRRQLMPVAPNALPTCP